MLPKTLVISSVREVVGEGKLEEGGDPILVVEELEIDMKSCGIKGGGKNGLRSFIDDFSNSLYFCHLMLHFGWGSLVFFLLAQWLLDMIKSICEQSLIFSPSKSPELSKSDASSSTIYILAPNC